MTSNGEIFSEQEREKESIIFCINLAFFSSLKHDVYITQ